MGKLRAGSVIGAASALVLCAGAPLAQGADLLDRDETAKGVYETPHQYFVGLSARGLYGHMEREGSDFFRKLQIDSSSVTVVDPDFVSFDNDEDFSGFEGEAFIGKRFGDYAIAFFVSGSVISSDVDESGSIEAADADGFHLMLPAPKLDDSKTFKWVATNQFDIKDYDYENDYDRREIAFGFRPTFYFGDDPESSLKDVSLKDTLATSKSRHRHMVQPMVFATLGTVDVDEHFAGFTDNDPPGSPSLIEDIPGNITFAYDNDIESDFTGIGFGLGLRGPLHTGALKIGYFLTAKATAEFHEADATADWAYDQIGPDNFIINGCTGEPKAPCNEAIKNKNAAANSSANLTQDETVWTLHLEGGLSFGLTNGIALELGGRYRRTEAPMVAIDGTQNAYIAFEEAEEIGGFLGLTAQF